MNRESMAKYCLLSASKGRWFLSVVGVGVLYYATARLGLLLAFKEINASPVCLAWRIEKALDEISEKKGTFYDSAVVDAYLKILIENGYRLE